MDTADLAPELDVTEWVGDPSPLEALRGRVVLVEVFQMLCPGCVSTGLPQAQKVRRLVRDVSVIGLHSVFENHDAMRPHALRAFMQQYGIDFPVGVDRHEDAAIPVTMARYGLRGTPSTLLIDKSGRLRFSHFGAVDDLALGTILGRLLTEDAPAAS